jgi:polyhydroxyalkanoate synthesis regulator phasin
MSIEKAKQAIEAAIHSGDFKSMGVAVFKSINALEERIKVLEEEVQRLKNKAQ